MVVGGRVASLGSNARHGGGEYIIVEADESDGSLLLLTPTIAVLTNIDADHLDFFIGGIEQIKQCFVTFANRVPFYGTIVLMSGRSNVQAIIPELTRRDDQLWVAPRRPMFRRGTSSLDTNFGSEFTVRAFGDELGRSNSSAGTSQRHTTRWRPSRLGST